MQFLSLIELGMIVVFERLQEALYGKYAAREFYELNDVYQYVYSIEIVIARGKSKDSKKLMKDAH